MGCQVGYSGKCDVWLGRLTLIYSVICLMEECKSL